MDVCVITFRNSAERAAAALRSQDLLFVRDNTRDNIGFAAGANVAAAQGSDPLLAFINPDGDPAPGCLEALERALDDPAVVAVEARVRPPVPGRQPQPGVNLDYVFATCLAVRRDAFEAVGGFDGRLFMYYEDIDLSYKLARHGELRVSSRALFNHDPGTRGFRMLHRLYRNHLVVERRHGRGSSPRVIVQLLRDAVGAARASDWSKAFARLTGTADYLIRGWRWVNRPMLLGG